MLWIRVEVFDILPRAKAGGIPTAMRWFLCACASVGSCFTERLYYTASPQALHRAHPSLGLATEGSYHIRLPHASKAGACAHTEVILAPSPPANSDSESCLGPANIT